MGDVAKTFDRLIASGRLPPADLCGCGAAEIAQVAAYHGAELPAAYAAFLSIAGKGAGKLFQGTTVYFPELLEIREGLEDVIAESGGPLPIPARAIVFLMHQSYTFSYLEPADGDDPQVWHYAELDAAPVASGLSFSDYLDAEVKSHLSVWPRLGRNDPDFP